MARNAAKLKVASKVNTNSKETKSTNASGQKYQTFSFMSSNQFAKKVKALKTGKMRRVKVNLDGMVKKENHGGGLLAAVHS